MKKIAVVEDNADNRLLVAALLEGLYEITEYESGAEALAGFAGQTPDLVLLDISLPGMDGTALLKHLRSHPVFRKIPVIALTAHAMAGDRERFLNQGFNDYITKPILEENQLLEAIQRCFSP
jgi:two-component system sensor histidine kinase/response regulator